jgi:hypothetical protein
MHLTDESSRVHQEKLDITQAKLSSNLHILMGLVRDEDGNTSAVRRSTLHVSEAQPFRVKAQ